MSNNTQEALIKDTDPRRVGFMRHENKWFIHKFEILRFRSPVMLPWIRDHTTGRFYLDSSVIAFDTESDYLMFKLGYPGD